MKLVKFYFLQLLNLFEHTWLPKSLNLFTKQTIWAISENFRHRFEPKHHKKFQKSKICALFIPKQVGFL